MPEFDVCVIGSGAGGGPVAATVAAAGRSVVVIEKGRWLRREDFFKDELGRDRHDSYTPDLHLEPQVVEDRNGSGGWSARPTPEAGWDFWNGSLVGGASNLMSGFFHRLKPQDFRLLSEFGPVDGANVADWPISYDDLEPFYDRVERVVGVSGRAVQHGLADRRSSADFPYPPLVEHPLAQWFDRTCVERGLDPIPVPRAILPHPVDGRRGCEYTGICAGYGCSSGAKGSSRAALLSRAVATGNCEVRAESMAAGIVSDARGRAVAVEYFDRERRRRRVTAKVFVVACQAIETARLLLMSTGPAHPRGLANRHGLVGKNLLFSAAGFGIGHLPFEKFSTSEVEELRSPFPFLNRALQDWYSFAPENGSARMKGGTLDFLLLHPDPISRAIAQTSAKNGPLWGWPLKRRLVRHFREEQHVRFEVFADWMPHDDCHVTLDPDVRDHWGLPVARVRVGRHPRNKRVVEFLTERGAEVLRAMGAERIRTRPSAGPSTNLLAGTCRFGDDPRTSVLDRDCRAHDVENLYVTDGSFMPTGGSVPYTWTIYANSFRVADRIVERLD